MNSIIYDYEIIVPKDDRHTYYYNFTNKLDKRDCVKFTLFCAKIVNPNTQESNACVKLVEKWLLDEKSVTSQELYTAAYSAYSNTAYAAYAAAAYAATYYSAAYAAYAANAATYSCAYTSVNIDIINKYLQILLRKTKQFGNDKILKQISKVDVDKLELVDWNMITDIIQKECNIVHEFEYKDIFSRRCLIELLRREYT